MSVADESRKSGATGALHKGKASGPQRVVRVTSPDGRRRCTEPALAPELRPAQKEKRGATRVIVGRQVRPGPRPTDRKSTRLNSSHVRISYAVFCLKTT